MPLFLSLQCPPSLSRLKFVSATKNAYPLQAIFAEIMTFHPILVTNLLALLVLVIWLYLAFLRGNFWRLEEDHLEPKPLEKWPRVVAIVPARNEAATIARAITSLLGQDYPGEFEIIVVDDHSDDGTAALARKAAEETGAAARITIHSAAELPQGWTGKLWALNEGISAVSGNTPDFFWFADADIVHAPDTLCRLVWRAETESLDLASLMVLLQAKTFPERLLIPPFLYFFLTLYPPRRIADPQKRTAGAAGGCLLLRRAALERIGGLASIRSEVIDDCALARAVKKTGGTLWMGVTRASINLRRNSRPDRPHRLHAALLFLCPACRHAARPLRHLLAAVDSFFRWRRSRLAPRQHRRFPYDGDVSLHGEVLQPLGTLGANPTFRCRVLRLRNPPLCHSILARPRRPMERPRPAASRGIK